MEFPAPRTASGLPWHAPEDVRAALTRWGEYPLDRDALGDWHSALDRSAA